MIKSLLLVVLLSGCGYNRVHTGPEGKEGPQGPAGASGSHTTEVEQTIIEKEIIKEGEGVALPLCPGLNELGWGGSSLSASIGLVVAGKLYGNIQANNGVSLGFQAVQPTPSCEEVLADTRDYAGKAQLETRCLNETNVSELNGKIYPNGVGNFAPNIDISLACAFRHMNDSETRTITIQRLMSRDDDDCTDANNRTAIRPCSSFTVLDSISVNY